MQRRNFLRILFGAAAAAAVAPYAKLLPAPAAPVAVIAPPVLNATIAEYADYISISDLAMDAANNEELNVMAKELSYRAALTCNMLILDQLNASPFFHRELGKAGYMIDQRELARHRRNVRRYRYVAKQRRRSARMAA
jgi:hypothetical protein